jgi:hypothetical protein
MLSNNVIGAALAKFFGNSKKEIPVGHHQIKGTVTIALDAVIEKLPSESYIPTVDLPIKKVLAIALQKAGVQRENILKIIQESATEALNDATPVSDYLEVTENSLRRVSEMLANLPSKQRDGKTVIAVNKAEIIGVS